MKIKKLIIKDFRNVVGTKVYELPHVGVLCGPNGIGKSTVLEALRYGITGVLPDGAINNNADSAAVGIAVVDGAGNEYDISRTVSRTKGNGWSINGRKQTGKAVDDVMEHLTGIPADRLKMITSGEVVKSMAPDALSKLLLEYIPNTMTREDVEKMFSSVTPGMHEILEANLPERVTIDHIDACAVEMKDQRRIEKKNAATLQAVLDTTLAEKPSIAKEDLDKRLKALYEADGEYKVYLTKVSQYEKAVKDRDNYIRMIDDLKKEYAGIPDVKHDPALTKRCQDTITFLTDNIAKQNGAKMSAQHVTEQLEKTLAALNTTVCPISNKIVCHEDKSSAKAELSASIEESRKTVQGLEEAISQASEKLSKCRAWLEKDNRNATLLARKAQIAGQVEKMEKNIPSISAKPAEMKPVDVSAEKARLEAVADQWKSYEKHLEAEKELKKKQTLVSDLDTIYKGIWDKGPVKKAIVTKYLGIFDDTINSRCRKPGVSFQFVPGEKGGVVLTANFGKGVLSYAALSSGEKAFATFMLMDLLAQLTGVRILMVDDADVCDAEYFQSLMDTIDTYAGDYDHILVAAVSHEDTGRILKKYESIVPASVKTA